MIKQILIPVAALAITATSVSAFSDTNLLSKLSINLTDTEKAALEEAREIRDTARKEADQVLEDAGITNERMEEIHDAMHEAREKEHEAIKAAIAANDFEAYKTAVANSPIADTIDTEAKFAKLVEAHKLIESGDKDGAHAIMDELGMKAPKAGGHGQMGGRGGQLQDR